jgi:hypothetical protein
VLDLLVAGLGSDDALVAAVVTAAELVDTTDG